MSDPRIEIERSIVKRFRGSIWRPFVRAVSDYDLIQPGDSIAVCVSGGKDSMLLAKCMQELQKRWTVPFELKFLTMDPGYRPENLQKLKENAALLGVPLHVFEAPVFDYVNTLEDSPCFICARMRRGYLYKNAKLLGCNKIALGHHFDDVVETILMSAMYQAQVRTMMPRIRSANYEGMELIRPLYLVEETAVLAWKEQNGLDFLRCACRFTEDSAGGSQDSKRMEMKRLLKELRKTDPLIPMRIFRSVHNVDLDTVIGYTQKGVRHSFLENFSDKEDHEEKE